MPILREAYQAISLDEIRENSSKPGDYIPHISEVKEYGRMNNLPYSIPQFIGHTQAYICMKYTVKKKGQKPKETWVTMINPLILKTEGLVTVEETQPEIEGIYLVPRHPRILVAYNTINLQPVQEELIGLAAIQFQQALHAISGIFISDIGLRVDNDPEYLEADDEGKGQIAQDYLKALKEVYSEALTEDKEMKEYVDATEFLAEKVEMANAREGVLPEEIQKKLDLEADEADNKAAKAKKKK